LTSLGLLAPIAADIAPGGEASDGSSGAVDEDACPACGQHLAEPDTPADELRRHLSDLRCQLANLNSARPAQHAELARLDEQVAAARARVAAAEEALACLAAGDHVTGPAAGAR
jgi:DNA repair exonuclease SbcCD ATPase subunit